MTVTVLDSTNLNAIVAEATGEPLEVEKSEAKADEKLEDEKPEEKTEAKDEEKAEAKDDEKKEETDPDDVEGEDGLTPRQKRDFTPRMLKTIGKKHRQMKEAEEFAAAQYNERKLAEQRAAELERQLAAARPQVEEQQQVQKEPQPDDFKTQKEYLDAVVDYKVAQQIAVRESQRAYADMINSAKSRINKAIELVPDYQAVIDKSGDIPVPPAISGYMQKSPMI
ncbi:MAG: hypothetical protein KGJ13_11745, partial [Patescibacteria group bacterium]|nr:hypothetical protein [Patescibacteria group bacterium]